MNDKLAIVELSTKNHISLVEVWALSLSKLGVDYVIYIRPEFFESLNADLRSKVELVPNGSMLCIGSLKRSRITGLVIVSLQTNFFLYLSLFIRLPPFYKIYLTIHNANTWFNPYLRLGLKSIVKRYMRRYFLAKASSIVVCSENIKIFSEQHFNAKDVFVVPFMHYDPSKSREKTKQDTITIAIPGTVDEIRRNYIDIISIVMEFPSKFTLILLGIYRKSSDSSAIDSLLESAGDNVVYFDDYVSVSTFDELIRGCDFLFSDVKVDYIGVEDYEERYGVSKDSGISYNMIKYSKPGLINSEFQNLTALSTSTLYFSSYGDLRALLLKMSEVKKTLEEVQEKSISNSFNFTIENISKNIKESLLL